MEPATNSNKSLFIVIEIFLGAVMAVLFLYLVDEDFWGKTIGDGIIRLYGSLSIIFFFSVILVGIIDARKHKKTHRIGRAVGFAALFHLLSLVISAWVIPVGGFIPAMFIILVGIVAGFNIGLEYIPRKKAE